MSNHTPREEKASSNLGLFLVNFLRFFPRNSENLLLFTVTFFSLLIVFIQGIYWFPLIRGCFISREAYNSEECQEGRLQFNISLILLLLTLLSIGSQIARFKTLNRLEYSLTEKINTLEQSVKKANLVTKELDVKRQVIPITGSKEWYRTATKLIKEAQFLVYDASLSSRTWYQKPINVDRENFDKARDEKFKNPDIDSRYLTTFKTYFPDVPSLIKHLEKISGEEYKIQIYEHKLQADIERLEKIKENIKLIDCNFTAAYLPNIELKNPMLSFLIIDKKKVLLGFYLSEFRESNINRDHALLIENEEIADLFTKYFDFLWENTALEFAHDSAEAGKLKELLEQLKKQKTEVE